MFSKFSELNEKTKTAVLFAIGMVVFLIAGSLVYFFPRPVDHMAISRTDDSSIDELFQNLTVTGHHASAGRGIGHSQPEVLRIRTETVNEWVLYVTGSVRNPGVYRLPEGARVFQLVDAAGGLTNVADTVAINMAAHLRDGDHLHVPQAGEEDSIRNRAAGEFRGTVIFTPNRQDNAARNRSPNRSSPDNLRIELNTATAEELQLLPRIGPAMSARIIQHREQNGRFRQVADLINVPGIGARVLESIEPFVFVR